MMDPVKSAALLDAFLPQLVEHDASNTKVMGSIHKEFNLYVFI